MQDVSTTGTISPRASEHRGKWGQVTPWKMDEKLKSENMHDSNQGSQV